jgi:hypothetical protein
VACIKAGKAAPVIRHGLPKVSATGERQATFRLHQRETQIVAELVGSNTCNALGIVARGNAPVSGLCRKLIGIGIDRATALHAYRGDMLCLIVRSIGQGARLELNGHGTGFLLPPEGGTAPPMRQNGQGRA